EPQGESAQHDEARPDLWGRVNAAVVHPNEVTSALGVQGRIMLLPGEICPALRLPSGGSASCR
ncbi:MAG: hypothetical protein PVI97_20910, partial [Candidatus Thiodiazotropha sp.]